ncbi:MAG: SPOR domain-containing protein [Desulfobacterales bacterium]|nr:SPOR domain-containing protein [Desulfobacterales bacterium]
MSRKTPMMADRHVNPITLPPEQTPLTDRIRLQIASLVNESMRDMQQQMAALVREQRRMAAVLEQMTRHLRLTSDETTVHAGDRDESELPLWIACGITDDKASGSTADAKPTPDMPSGPHDAPGRPKNIDSPAMGKASHGDALPSRKEEELPLDLLPTGWPRPAAKTRFDDSHDKKTVSDMPVEASVGTPQPKSEAAQCPTADGTTVQDPRPDRSVAQDSKIDEPNMDTGEIPSGSPIFFPPKGDSRPATGKFIWALTALGLIAAAFWLASHVLSPGSGSTVEPSATAAPAPNPSATFQRITLPKKQPLPPLQPPSALDATPHPLGKTSTDPINHLSMAVDPLPLEVDPLQPEADNPSGDDNAALTIPPKGATVQETAGKTTTRLPRYPYTILIASVRTPAQANRAVAQYGRIGLSPYWAEVDLEEKGIWYRVFSGLFETPEAAKQQVVEKGLADALVKHTPWVARVGTYDKGTAEAVSRRLVQETPWMPYSSDAGEGRQSVYVGAFYTEAGARRQCDILGARGVDCTVGKR